MEVHEVDPIVSLSTQVLALANQIVAFTTREASSSKESTMVANTSYTCEGVDQEQCQYVNNQNLNYRLINLSTHYHLGLRNHENFLMPIQGMLYNYPQGFNNQ